MLQLVDATRPRPARSGLRSSANLVPESGARWEGGLTWQANLCGPVHTGPNGVCTFSGFGPAERADDDPEYVPTVVDAFAGCSTMGGQQAVDEARAVAGLVLDTCQWPAIEAELWRGNQARAEGYPNEYLASGTTNVLGGGTPLAVIDALAELEDGLATCSCGGISMIHATPATVTMWAALYLVERLADGRIVTVQGTLVVNGAGYDGSGPTGGGSGGSGGGDGPTPPAAGTAWAYGTGMVDVRLGLEQESEFRDGISHRANSFEVGVWRNFAATFDPCCHLGVLVDLNDRT